MKLEKITVVGQAADGTEIARVRVRASDGTLHRVLCPTFKMQNPHSFAGHVRSATGRALAVSDEDAQGWHGQIAGALAAGNRPVPRNEGGYIQARPAYFSGTDVQVRGVASRLYGALQDFLNTGSGDPDALAELLSNATNELDVID